MKDSKEKLFKSNRWHEDVGAVVINHEEQSGEEKKNSKVELDKILKERGIK